MEDLKFNKKTLLFRCLFSIMILAGVSLLRVDWFAQEEDNIIAKASSTWDHGAVYNANRLPPFQAFLKLHHPECINDQKQINISIGKYVYHPVDAAAYDHSSCFVMKARYNCAKSNDTNPKDLASNYRYLWRRSEEDTEYCDTRTVFEEYAIHSNNSILDSVSLSNSYILLLGNSYLRQIWESWTCMFTSSVVELRVNEYGPLMSNKATRERGNRLLNISDLGTTMTLDRAMAEGCHGIDSQSVYEKAYPEGVTPPPTLLNRNCSDDIALAEFRNNLKVAFLFRPYNYDDVTLQYIFKDRLNIGQEDNLVVAHNHEQAEDIAIRMNSSFVLDLTALKNRLKRVQNSTIQRYFGADNAWITEPPDSHPCMPGIPDDESFLLLFSILMGYELE